MTSGIVHLLDTTGATRGYRMIPEICHLLDKVTAQRGAAE